MSILAQALAGFPQTGTAPMSPALGAQSNIAAYPMVGGTTNAQPQMLVAGVPMQGQQQQQPGQPLIPSTPGQAPAIQQAAQAINMLGNGG